ncbi:MAG TPA: hypothetical protein VII50_09550 [Acidothermaceae bacterium]|jgi:hypothetical protein
MVAGDEAASDDAGADAGLVDGPVTPEERCLEATLSQALSCSAAATHTPVNVAATAFRLTTMTNRRSNASLGCI